MPRVLRNLRINEVSGVDKGAGRGVRIMLMKRDDAEQIDWSAVKAVQAKESEMTLDDVKKMIDEAVAEKVAELDKAKRPVNPPKPSTATSEVGDDDPVDKLGDGGKVPQRGKKNPLHDSDSNPGAEENDQPSPGKSRNKRDEDAIDIEKALAPIRKENDELKKVLGTLMTERRLVEFTKRATGVGLADADGEVMMKAFDGDVEAQGALLKRFEETHKALKAQAKSSVIFGEFGKAGGDGGAASAYQELEAKAAELRKATPGLTPSQAFAKVYTDPANREIIDREKREAGNRLAKIAAATGQ